MPLRSEFRCPMADDWPFRFRQFTLSIDAVDDATVENVKALLKDYFCTNLKASFFRILMDGFKIRVDGLERACLRTVWSEIAQGDLADSRPDIPILNQSGDCTSQTSYAYYHRAPLWITAEDDITLAEAARSSSPCVDSWSQVDDLPAYGDYGKADAKTSVIIPLEYDGRLFGVVNLEFRDRLEITEYGKWTLKAVTESLGRVVWLHQTHRSQRKDTGKAFRELQDLYRLVSSPLEPRTVFVSCSERADQEVIEIILRVLGRFEPLFQIKHWKEEAMSGSISEQVRKDIRTCEFGVCYLSERLDEQNLPPGSSDHWGKFVKEMRKSGFLFADNPNVLFEAGMLQMLHELRSSPQPGLSNWIPIREAPGLTPSMPFNFAGDRIVMVPRNEDARLNAQQFEESFENAVTTLVQALNLR